MGFPSMGYFPFMGPSLALASSYMFGIVPMAIVFALVRTGLWPVLLPFFPSGLLGPLFYAWVFFRGGFWLNMLFFGMPLMTRLVIPYVRYLMNRR